MAQHKGDIHVDIPGNPRDLLKIRSKVPYPVAKGWKTLIDFTARDNPKVRDVKIKDILDDSIIRELDESGFIAGLGLK